MNQVYQQIDESRTHACVLCLAGVPGKKDNVLSHHHAFKRSELPGKANEELLWNPVNIAIACEYHHSKFGNPPFRWLWALAMIRLGQASESDYEQYPFTDEEYRIASPLLGDCLGEFGYGDGLSTDRGFKTIQSVWFGKEDARLDLFCQHLCRRANQCLELTRERIYKEING